MTKYLLDTNVVSSAVRDPGGAVDAALRRNKDTDIGISVVVRGEILFGLKRNANIRGRERLDALLEAMTVWDLEGPVGDIYGEIRWLIQRQGEPMGANDLWIAAHSIALDATLVTDDRAFSRVPGLKIENWLRP